MIFLKLTLANTDQVYTVNFEQVRYYFHKGNFTIIVIETIDGNDQLAVNEPIEYIDQKLGLTGRRTKN